jgi:hypothetical protein
MLLQIFKRCTYKTSKDRTSKDRTSKDRTSKYIRSRPQNVPAPKRPRLKTSQLQNVQNTKRPSLETTQASKRPKCPRIRDQVVHVISTVFAFKIKKLNYNISRVTVPLYMCNSKKNSIKDKFEVVHTVHTGYK